MSQPTGNELVHLETRVQDLLFLYFFFFFFLLTNVPCVHIVKIVKGTYYRNCRVQILNINLVEEISFLYRLYLWFYLCFKITGLGLNFVLTLEGLDLDMRSYTHHCSSPCAFPFHLQIIVNNFA